MQNLHQQSHFLFVFDRRVSADVLVLWIDGQGDGLQLVAQAQLPGGGALIQRGHDIPVVFIQVDIKFLQSRQIVKFCCVSRG